MNPTQKWVRVYPTPRGVYPTLRHMGGLVKHLDQVYGVRIAAIVDAQAEREDLFRMVE